MIVDFGHPGYRIRENDDHTLTLVYEDTERVCRNERGQEIVFSQLAATPKVLAKAVERQEEHLAGLHETLTELYGRERWTVGRSA